MPTARKSEMLLPDLSILLKIPETSHNRWQNSPSTRKNGSPSSRKTWNKEFKPQSSQRSQRAGLLLCDLCVLCGKNSLLFIPGKQHGDCRQRHHRGGKPAQYVGGGAVRAFAHDLFIVRHQHDENEQR